MKQVVSILLVVISLGMLSACGSSKSCDSYGDTSTKGYHYTFGPGLIIFACDDCYKEIQELNS